VHGDGRASILGSTNSLTSYGNSLYAAQHWPEARSDDKGKRKVEDGKRRNHSALESSPEPPRRKEQWMVPEEGWIKLNTDASFCPSSGVASAGIIARDNEGRVLLTAWRSLRNCGSPEEAEAEACLQGLQLIAEWIGKPAHVESDCSNLIHDLAKEKDNRSAWAGVLQEIRAAKHLLPACRFFGEKRTRWHTPWRVGLLGKTSV
jgi:ribonuclease HI